MSGGSLSPERFAEDISEAAQKFEVIQSDGSTLLLDLDTPEALAQFERVLPKVKDVFGITKAAKWSSKSGNTHALVALSEPLPVLMRLALQAALGSDGVREVLALKRWENGCHEPSVLFRPRENQPTEIAI